MKWPLNIGKKPSRIRLPKASGPRKPKAPFGKRAFGKRRKPAPTGISLAIEVAGRLEFWQVQGGIARQVDRPDETEGTIYRVSSKDHRMVIGRRSTAKQRKSKAMIELAEKPAVAMSAAFRDRMYFTPMADATLAGRRLAPLSIVLDLLEKESPYTLPAVIGVYLEGEDPESPDGKHGILIMWVVQKDRNSSAPVVVVNPPDVVASAHKMAADHKLPEDPTIGFWTADQLEQALVQQKVLYPAEEEWNGISVRHLKQASALGLLGYTVLSGSALGMALLQKQNAQAEQMTLAMALQAEQQKIEQVISGNIVGFAREMSIKPQQLMQDAQMLWKPGTTVVAEVDGQKSQLRLQIPLAASSGGQAVNIFKEGTQESTRLRNALRATPPKGYVRDSFGTSQNANTYYVQFTKQQSDSVFNRYRGN